MRALSTAELLTIWELGVSQPWEQRALSLLAAACTDNPKPDQSAQFSIGQRDGCLLALRERLFGPRLSCVTPCPACGQLVEFAINTFEIGAQTSLQTALKSAGTIELSHADYAVLFRLPNGLDMTNLDPKADTQTNRQVLLSRCVLSARFAGAEVASDDLPPEVVSAVAERMAEADPQAEVQIELACPKCEQSWQTPFDILSFLWSEIHSWANRQLHDVHVLASAYSWRETDILAMSPARRQAYMEFVRP